MTAPVWAQQSDSLATVPQQAVPAAQSADVPAAADAETLWTQANEAYLNSDYAGAVRLYESILDEGLFSMKLYYNLANAYFKTGEIGKSILFYKRALILSPSNDDIRHNLSLIHI